MGKETKKIDIMELKNDPLKIEEINTRIELIEKYKDRVEFNGSRGETAQQAFVEFDGIYDVFNREFKELTRQLNERLREAGIVFTVSEDLLSRSFLNGKGEKKNRSIESGTFFEKGK